MEEQAIVANIQELQRRLSTMHLEGASSSTSGEGKKQRLLMISNRLPISVKRDKVNPKKFVFKMSSGGLVSALAGIRDRIPFIWIGWLGQEIEEDEKEGVRLQLLKEYNCVPVFLKEDIASMYYNGFSNDVLWPIFHYVPLPIFRAGSEKKFDFKLWDAYVSANKEFEKVVAGLYEKGDLIWVHDYHLMVLPSLLRKQFPESKIGWFLHTPFPSSEVYRILPVRKQILDGLLGVDLLGFHTYDYARHFLSACSRIVGIHATPKGIQLENHFVSIGVFPIGIEPAQFSDRLKGDETQTRLKDLAAKFKGKKLIVGVDRLDYIKGMPHKLLAIEKFFVKYPQYSKDTVLVQIGVPSRTGVEEYQHLGFCVNELVGRINGEYSTLHHVPIHYINQSITPYELTALYNLADVCFVSSVRDGMNLVSHEYVACQDQDCPNRKGPGVLVLSEFAGSAQSLSGAIRVNPWNADEMADALFQAFEMPQAERELRQLELHRYVTKHTSSFWAESFMADFNAAIERSESIAKLQRLSIPDATDAYADSKRRLIVCDYDGTLAPLQSLSTIAAPKLYLKSILGAISEDPKNTLVLVSGRDRATLSSWFGNSNIGLAAESGYYMKMDSQSDWTVMGMDADESWTGVVRPIMKYFKDRTPGSFIEEKETALSWHYCDADAEFGNMQARDLQIHLEDVLSSLPIEVIQGYKVVEVRIQGTSKARVITEILEYFGLKSGNSKKFDFVFVAGDDQTDEVMFTTLHEFQENATPEFEVPITEDASVYTCHVGANKSQANYYLDTVSEMRRLLRSIAAVSRDGAPLAGAPRGISRSALKSA